MMVRNPFFCFMFGLEVTEIARGGGPGQPILARQQSDSWTVLNVTTPIAIDYTIRCWRLHTCRRGPHRLNASSCPLMIKADIAIGFEGWKRKFCRAFDLRHGYFVPRTAFKMFVPLYFSEMSC